jgi:hypothetical protein
MTTKTTTKHRAQCSRAYRNYDSACPRCQELSLGAPPRPGWQSHRQSDESALSLAIQRHNCKTSGCLSVCTAFDW